MTLRFITSEPGADPIIVEGYFLASQAKLFRAWTDPEIVMKWFGSAPNSLHSATIDLRKGGSWQFLEASNNGQSVGFEGQYLEFETDKRLMFTWRKFATQSTGEREASPYSQVEVTFTARKNGTLVQVIHSNIRSEDTRRHFTGGWDRAFSTMHALFL